MGIDTHEERTIDPFELAIITNCLADRQDMGLIEAGRQGSPSMTRSPEFHSLLGYGWVRAQHIEGTDESRNVGELRIEGPLSRKLMSHYLLLLRDVSILPGKFQQRQNDTDPTIDLSMNRKQCGPSCHATVGLVLLVSASSW